MIVVEHLSKQFFDLRRGHVTAVNDISFRCAQGEVVGLLGPNGAGKTTTLRILSTILKPSSGVARIDGIQVDQAPEEVRRRIGYMSASTQLYDRMTAWELVSFFGSLYDLEGERLTQRMEAVFDWLGMNDFRDVPVAKMSTGMKQKVSIARAVVHDPPVLILDEPTSNLDILVARALVERIEELANQGKTILLSSHTMAMIERLCHRVIILYKGMILESGPLKELKARYKAASLDDLFFDLIDQCDARATPSAMTAADALT